MACSTCGSLLTGYMAPERKNIGIMMKFMITWKPCMLLSRDATTMPSPVIEKEQHYDRLAELVRNSLNIPEIYRILEAGI